MVIVRFNQWEEFLEELQATGPEDRTLRMTFSLRYDGEAGPISRAADAPPVVSLPRSLPLSLTSQAPIEKGDRYARNPVPFPESARHARRPEAHRSTCRHRHLEADRPLRPHPGDRPPA